MSIGLYNKGDVQFGWLRAIMDAVTLMVFQLISFLIHAIQPILVPLCLVLAWGLIILLLWSVVAAIADTVRRTQRMHQIPCANCTFFTKDYHLKCPVQPTIALSEQAIDCPDFCATRNLNLDTH